MHATVILPHFYDNDDIHLMYSLVFSCLLWSSHDMIDDFSRDFVHIHKQSNPKEIHTLTKEGSEKTAIEAFLNTYPLNYYKQSEFIDRVATLQH